MREGNVFLFSTILLQQEVRAINIPRIFFNSNPSLTIITLRAMDTPRYTLTSPTTFSLFMLDISIFFAPYINGSIHMPIDL